MLLVACIGDRLHVTSQQQTVVSTQCLQEQGNLYSCDISVIAYGQKGSGKTYTILGPGLHCAFSETEYGIIPRATREIFYNLMGSLFISGLEEIECQTVSEVFNWLHIGMSNKQLPLLGSCVAHFTLPPDEF
ncbi:unnamed protein product [Timema podura]|uniref:Kinesin motor domain-containing protein n=1 Tax=Timema podura TaxID=61482 RepID=A0ABN7NPJ4_TIMPD|nr:unnamed protein product [Timema podura]